MHTMSLTPKGTTLTNSSSLQYMCLSLDHLITRTSFCDRFYNIAHTRQTMEIDGINSLKYQVIRIVKDQLFTKIVVDIGRQWGRKYRATKKPRLPHFLRVFIQLMESCFHGCYTSEQNGFLGLTFLWPVGFGKSIRRIVITWLKTAEQALRM